jgi:hypothetical protein
MVEPHRIQVNLPLVLNHLSPINDHHQDRKQRNHNHPLKVVKGEDLLVVVQVVVINF